MTITDWDSVMALPCSRLAFFAGSFDPIHNGHVMVAEAALRRFVDMVIFCTHSHNQQKILSPIHHRLEIIRRLLLFSPFHSSMALIDPDFCHGIENDRFIEISERLIESGRKVFILKGQDSLIDRKEYCLRRFDHIIHNRGGIGKCLDNVIEGQVFRFDSVSDMSSTEARRNLAKGMKVHPRDQLHNFILKNGLYAQQSPAGDSSKTAPEK